MLRGLVVVGGLVLVVGVVAELAAPRLVEAGIEETVRSHTDDAARVEARAAGSPFLPRLLLDGVVERVEVTLTELGGQQLAVGTVSLTADGIQLDRAAMYRGEVEVTAIDTGTVTLLLDEAELSDALGVPIDLDPRVVELAGTALEIAGRGVLDVPLDAEVMPCTPELEVEPPYVRLSCTFDEIPGVLRTVRVG